MFIAAYLSGAESIDLDRVGDYSRSESLLARFAKAAGKESADLTEEDIDQHRMAVQERLARDIGQRVINTHNARLTHDHRRLVFSRYTRAAVYIVRNPLDVVDSWADHINRTLDETIDLMNQSRHRLRATKTHASQYVGTWTHHVRTWMNNKNEFPRIVLRYEDLKENPINEFGRLVRFLGWNYDEMRLRRAIELTDFQVVQKAELEQGFTETSDVARSGRFFRHGEPGRWRELLSPDQIAKVVEHHGDAMREAGYEIPELLVAARSSGSMTSTRSSSAAIPPAESGINVNVQATQVRSDESQTSRSWKKWIAVNVLRDNDGDNLIRVLVANGISEQVARQEVDSATSHPYIDAARSLVRQIKKRDWIFDTMRLLQNEDKTWEVERHKDVGDEEFLREYYFRNRPVILTDAMANWMAMQRWTPDYLKGRCGEQMVQVQVRRESNPRYEIENQSHKSIVRFADYVDQVFNASSTNDFYMTANNGGANRGVLPALRDDFDLLPNYLDAAIADERVFFLVRTSRNSDSGSS